MQAPRSQPGGEQVVVGHEGVRVHTPARPAGSGTEVFEFMA